MTQLTKVVFFNYCETRDINRDADSFIVYICSIKALG